MRNVLEKVLKSENVMDGMKYNLFNENASLTKESVEKILKTDNRNELKTCIEMDGVLYEFEVILFYSEEKNEYLIDCRLFNQETQMMKNAYLGIFDANLNIAQEEIDDVWVYTDWLVA